MIRQRILQVGRDITRSPKKSLAVIFLLALLAFSNIFPNQFVMDDFDYIVHWPLIQEWKNFHQFFIDYVPPERQEGIYSPLKTLFHAINYHLFKLHAVGYHVVALLIHFTGIFFVYRLSLFLTKDPWVTFFSTFFFAVHPALAEPVISMTGSVDVIGIVLLFASFYYYLKAQEKDVFNKKHYMLAIALSIFSVYTHELAISLPLLFLWHDFCFARDRFSMKQIFLRIAPFFTIVLLYAFTKFLVLGDITRGDYLYGSFYLTMVVMIKAWVKYVFLCLAPTTLTHNHIITQGIFSYSPNDFDSFAVLSQSLLQWETIFALIVLGIIFTLAVNQFRKQRLIAFCIGWFFICLLPVSNIIPSSVLFAERYLYPGLFGFCLLMAYFVQRLLAVERVGIRKIFSGIACFYLIFVFIYYPVRIWVRSWDWRNEVTFFESAVRENPQSTLMKTDLGIIYTLNGRPSQGLELLQKARNQRPDDPEIYFSLAEAYVRLQDYEMAVSSLQKAISLRNEYPEAYYNLASIYAYQGSHEEAMGYFNVAMLHFKKQGQMEKAKKYQLAFYKYLKAQSQKHKDD